MPSTCAAASTAARIASTSSNSGRPNDAIHPSASAPVSASERGP
jgi:hypothetical protein